MKINHYLCLSIVVTALLSGCYDRSNQQAVTDDTKLAPQLQTSIHVPEKIDNITGFANQKRFSFNRAKQQLFSYQEDGYSSLLELTLEQPQKGQLLACQTYQNDEIHQLPLSTKQMSEALDSSANIENIKIKAALCGNIQADMGVDVIVLLQQEQTLLLMLGSTDNNMQVDHWREITSFPAKEDRQYMLWPQLIAHSATSISIMQYQNKNWSSIKELLPGDFIESFTYEPTDHTEMWAEYIKLDRASAKLMWNGGAKSMAQLDKYIDSIDNKLPISPNQYKKEIEQLLLNLDPNKNEEVASRLASIYVNWKQSP
ncbi:hypothetical protein HG263_15500 [Pseudoalteromonas sp. JBTF-M23]|uniref:Lipoprotein n=1 Tax=Pseudoalteromonas caenipelagi TaxID=2726988 RepID=A0A849VJZ6_9GAMM|nr:hypothetical protein [Pseudoalteromonas caenipelagi]NOU51937.1 hypothetical protein [Pseudoalteromonas caenipelagi]